MFVLLIHHLVDLILNLLVHVVPLLLFHIHFVVFFLLHIHVQVLGDVQVHVHEYGCGFNFKIFRQIYSFPLREIPPC